MYKYSKYAGMQVMAAGMQAWSKEICKRKKGCFTLPEGHQISVPQYLVYPAKRIKRLLLINLQFIRVHISVKK
jgi:hypothetical protein